MSLIVPSSTDPDWYKDAVIYELHVRSYFDSNDDGIGDFQGLIQKLDYIQDLGVNTIWLLPFYPSPLRDDGYDIANYSDIHPSYGTMRDFRLFLREAHNRGLRVFTELVVNHTSDQHRWFQAARRAAPDSAHRNYYVWSETGREFKDARIIFTDTEASNWTWDPVAKAYYWHRFFSHQPDLNYDNPRVLKAVMRVMRHWLDMGVDGLRLDAVPYLIEREGTICENLPETHDILKQLRRSLDQTFPDRALLAEANQWPADVRPYFGDGDECHMAYHFPLMPRIFMAVRQEDAMPIVEIMRQTPEIPPSCQWALFLRNHDELTLEMVTDEERDYMYSSYAADPQMRLNVGIRRRLAPLMDHNRSLIELLNSLLLSMPGSPIIYYGDEIGMGDNVYLGDRNGVRTPMQWTGDRNAGFSRADPARLFAPPVMDPVYGYQSINVEAQERSPSSLLNWMRRLLALRRQYRTFGRSSFEPIATDNRRILAYRCRQHGEDRAARASRSASVQRDAPGRADWQHRAAHGRRGSVLPDLGAAWLLLVPTLEGGQRDRAAASASRRPGRTGAHTVGQCGVGAVAGRTSTGVARAGCAARLPAATALVRGQVPTAGQSAFCRLGAPPSVAAAVCLRDRGELRVRTA
jgi:maltose alpha-D-glucosyltransferase/alpha-amylase